ncbi:MAG: SDR family oxidoreductase [Bacteroidetes bacterium]|nr:MAG: SDR family oxidoreductase [Bacteroidota bacterium]
MSNSQKIALVTGANRGIGFAVAKGLLEKGVTVIATSRREEAGRKATEKLKAYGPVVYHQLDVNDRASIALAAEFIEREYERLDILINNAGINYDTWQQTTNADLDEVHQTLETNLFGPWRLTQAFLSLLRKSPAGRIVNVSSGAGDLNSQSGQRPAYSISKLALNGLTLQFANLLQADGILVNSVCPGWVRTDMGGSNADRSPEEGAETIIWAGLLPDGGPTGKFFRDKQEIAW